MIRRPPKSTPFPYPTPFQSLLRFGRGMDNRRIKATGYRFGYTTRETVLKLREHQRLAPIVGSRSEEHTSELQSRQYPACPLLLEKKHVAARPPARPTPRAVL